MKLNGINMGLTKQLFKQKKFIVFFIAIILLYYSFSLVDFDKFFEVVSEANLWLILLVYPISFVSIMTKSFKFKKILNALKEDYKLFDLAQIFTIGFFLGFLTPGRIGDFSRAMYLKDKVPLAKGGVGVFLDRVIDVFVLLTYALISITLFFVLFQQVVFPIEILFLLIFLLVLGFLFIINLKKFEFITRFFFQFTPVSFKEFLRKVYSNLNEATSYIKNDYAKLLFPLIIGFVAWSINFIIGLVIILAFGIDVPFYFIFLLMPIVTLVEIVPISVSGLGTREVASIFIFSFFGIPPEQAVAFSITFFLSLYPVIALIGFYFSMKRKISIPLKTQKWGV